MFKLILEIAVPFFLHTLVYVCQGKKNSLSNSNRSKRLYWAGSHQEAPENRVSHLLIAATGLYFYRVRKRKRYMSLSFSSHKFSSLTVARLMVGAVGGCPSIHASCSRAFAQSHTDNCHELFFESPAFAQLVKVRGWGNRKKKKKVKRKNKERQQCLETKELETIYCSWFKSFYIPGLINFQWIQGSLKILQLFMTLQFCLSTYHRCWGFFPYLQQGFQLNVIFRLPDD